MSDYDYTPKFWSDLDGCKGKGIYPWLDAMGSVNFADLAKGIVSKASFYELSEWSDPSQYARDFKNYSALEKTALITQVNEAFRLTVLGAALTRQVISMCKNTMSSTKNIFKMDSFTACASLAELLADSNEQYLRDGLRYLTKIKFNRYDIGSVNKPNMAFYFLSEDHLTQYKMQLQVYLESVNINLRKHNLQELTLGVTIPTDVATLTRTKSNKGFWSRFAKESYTENELQSAQEGIITDTLDALDDISDLTEVAVAFAYGAVVIPMIILSPMIARLGNNEPALFKTHDFKTSLKGLRSLFGSYMGSRVGFVGNGEKKLRKALDAFRSNKTPIYVNEIMWDRVKEFKKKYESVFDNVKALISKYQSEIGPKSKGKFRVDKDDSVFEAANHWLERYLCISDDITAMSKEILKDVNGAQKVEKVVYTQGVYAGTHDTIPAENEKTGRRISPDVKVSESEFYSICNEDLCLNFKKTFRANKVLGKIKNRKSPATQSMKENFESAISELCRAYMYYVCYIYTLCSEAYHREEK